MGFLVSDDVCFNRVDQFSISTDKTFEILTIEAKIDGKTTSFSSIYHSPNPPKDVSTIYHHNQFIENLENLLVNLKEHFQMSYICMDSNIDLIRTPSEISNKFTEVIHTTGFVQHIEKATRIQGESFTLIDQIISNGDQRIKSGVLVEDISDHFLTFIQTNSKMPKKVRKPVETRQINTASLNRFKNYLRNLRWDDVTSSNDVDKSYEAFWNTFYSLFELNFPLKTAKFNKKIHKINNYMTEGLLKSRETKMRLFEQSRASPNAENRTKYNNYRNVFNKVMRASKKLYFSQNLSKNRKNPKKTWDLLREVMGTLNGNPKVSDIKIGQNTISDPREIAEQFNKHFVGACREISDSVPKTNITPESFLTDDDSPDLEFGKTSPAHVRGIIKLLKSKSSTDINGISMKLLKFVSEEISTPLSHVFNLSLSKGKFPELLKGGKVVPVHKGGQEQLCDNYRPIALLNTISKILEKIVAISLTNHLELNKLLNNKQFGFQMGKSTQHNLLLVTDYVSKALNEGDYCVGIFLDLKKAFDVCSHEILLKKLENIGVKGTKLEWFKSYLSNRTQVVEIQGHVSNPLSIDMSILQGSILGPLLFLVYINDLPRASELETFLFADDTSGLARGKNLGDLIDNINIQLKKWANWFKANKLKVNTSKTKYIIFHNKTKKVEMGGKEIYFDDNNENENFPEHITKLERVHSDARNGSDRYYKLLGVLFDENLTFSDHISMICNKLRRAIFIMNRVKNYLPTSSLKNIYQALFQSHLNYCPSIYGCAQKVHIIKLERLQRKAIRLISRSHHRAPTDELFYNLKILPVTDIIIQSNLSIIHEVQNGFAPSAFENIWPSNNSRNIEINLRNRSDLALPLPKTEMFKRFPAYTLPKLWNAQNFASKYHRNRLTFKTELKQELLNRLNPENQIAQLETL